MAMNQKIWKIINNKASEVEAYIVEEQIIEEMLSAKIDILNEGWLIIGRQVLTTHSK